MIKVGVLYDPWLLLVRFLNWGLEFSRSGKSGKSGLGIRLHIWPKITFRKSSRCLWKTIICLSIVRYVRMMNWCRKSGLYRQERCYCRVIVWSPCGWVYRMLQPLIRWLYLILHVKNTRESLPVLFILTICFLWMPKNWRLISDWLRKGVRVPCWIVACRCTGSTPFSWKRGLLCAVR